MATLIMRIVILTGGSEIVAAALAEAFCKAKIPIAIVSLVDKSILREAVPDTPYGELVWPPVSTKESAKQLIGLLRSWGADQSDRWPILPTEDGGLRLLLEQRRLIESVSVFGRARALQLGGLDKAELFTWLEQNGCADIIAPTRAIQSISEVKEAVAELGGKCVIKPALKPLSMQLTGMPAKAFMTADYPDQETLEEALSAAWNVADQWIVQPHLVTPSIGEAVFWGVRDGQGDLIGMGAVERWKQPRNGGTGCWVMTRNDLTESLQPLASRILETIDFVGICELPFLLDSKKKWQLLELNPRPWLQVGLAHAAGAPLELMVVKVLQGLPVQSIMPRDQVAWVNLERLLMAAWSGEQGTRWNALRRAFQVWRNAETVAIYDSSLPHIRRRWLMRLAGKAWKRLHA